MYKLNNVEVNVFSSFVYYRSMKRYDFCLFNNRESNLRFVNFIVFKRLNEYCQLYQTSVLQQMIYLTSFWTRDEFRHVLLTPGAVVLTFTEVYMNPICAVIFSTFTMLTKKKP